MSECLRSTAKRVLAWKIRLHRVELKMLAAEVAKLQNEAECYRLAKQIYEEILKLDKLLKEKEEENENGKRSYNRQEC